MTKDMPTLASQLSRSGLTAILAAGFFAFNGQKHFLLAGCCLARFLAFNGVGFRGRAFRQ